MKKDILFKPIIGVILGVMMLSSPITAYAVETPTIERTKAWDTIERTLGGIPESVQKIEYAGSVFYLGKDVTEADFLAVLAAGPETVRMVAPKDSGSLYRYPVYILWNSDKTILLTHPIIYDYDLVLEDVSTPAAPPASITVSAPVKNPQQMTATEKQEYMLSAEYSEAVRTEFYRLLNEHRTVNGLRELEINADLQAYADIRADEQRTLFGHKRPDGTPAGSGWRNSWNVLNSPYAENILATGALHPDPLNTAYGIFSIWKESDGHNKHMLYDFTDEITMGFGIVPELDSDGFVTSGAVFASGY
jgi:uncharacterized protein YkwD